jgi:hypothetical protein
MLVWVQEARSDNQIKWRIVMPQRIDEMPKSNRGRAKKYDFSDQFDGNTWVIVKGDDFDCEVASIRAHLYREVREAGKSLKSSETEVKGQPALAFKVTDEKPKEKTEKQSDTSKAKTPAAA